MTEDQLKRATVLIHQIHALKNALDSDLTTDGYASNMLYARDRVNCISQDKYLELQKEVMEKMKGIMRNELAVLKREFEAL